MLNYEVDSRVLGPDIPAGTELDFFQGTCFVSMVGFLFDQSRLWGRIPIPRHSSFEEVNLRFYVKRQVEDETRRGVVFVKELVPSRSVTWVARHVFQENYQRVPMRRVIAWNDPADSQFGGRFGYQWRTRGRWSEVWGETKGPLAELAPGSMEQFIAEHYWGYSSQADGTTLEYRVEHPPWRVWQVEACSLEADIEALYGSRFVPALSGSPHSAFIAEGSDVAVYRGVAIA